VEISFGKRHDALIVSVAGRMDGVSAPEFDSKMEELFNQGEKGIVLDFERLEYMSSAGLRSILLIAKKAKAAGGKVSCCALQPMVRKVFELAGFAGMIPVFDSLEDALNQ
jgi:anti-sigma B factor antagonist